MAMNSYRLLGRVALLAAAAITVPAIAPAETAPPNAAVYIISPKDGDTVASPFEVQFGLSGMGIAPAGVEKANTGHHHLIVDAPLPPMDQPVPNDPQHIHLGGGQTEIELTLPPGRHTLQLLLADKDHLPFDPPVVSPRITITVAAPGASQ